MAATAFAALTPLSSSETFGLFNGLILHEFLLDHFHFHARNVFTGATPMKCPHREIGVD